MEWIAIIIAAVALYRSEQPQQVAMSVPQLPQLPLQRTIYTNAAARAPMPAISTPVASSMPTIIDFEGALSMADIVPASGYVQLSKAVYHQNMSAYTQMRADFEV